MKKAYIEEIFCNKDTQDFRFSGSIKSLKAFLRSQGHKNFFESSKAFHVRDNGVVMNFYKSDIKEMWDFQGNHNGVFVVDESGDVLGDCGADPEFLMEFKFYYAA